MKIIKYALLVIIVLAIIIFGRGVLTPSVTYENEVITNKSAVETWAIMQDESRVSEWLTAIDKMEQVSGTPGTVGAVSNIYVTENGEEMVMQETIKSIVANEHIAMTFTMDFMNMDYEMHLTEMDGKTKIISKSTTTGNGIFAKSIISFMTSTMSDQENENLNRLKQVIDQNQKAYPVEN